MDLSEEELSFRENHENKSLIKEKKKKAAGKAVITSMLNNPSLHLHVDVAKGEIMDTVNSSKMQGNFIRHALRPQYLSVQHQDFPVAITQSPYLGIALSKLKIPHHKAVRVRQLLPSFLLRKVFTYIFWMFYIFKYQQYEDPTAADLAEDLRAKLKQKYRKLFILCRKPKEHLFDVLPFVFSVAIKEGILDLMPKAKGNWDEGFDLELHDFVQRELNGYNLSLLSLTKNIERFVSSPPDKFKKSLQDAREVRSKERGLHRPSVRYNSPSEIQEFKSRLRSVFDQEPSSRRAGAVS